MTVEPTESAELDAHDAAVEAIASTSPAGSSDHERRHREPTPDEDALQEAGAVAVLRRGVAATPELRQGLLLTGLLAVLTAAGKLAVPV